MYPWYKENHPISVSKLYSPPAPPLSTIKKEAAFKDCMVSLDYSQNKVIASGQVDICEICVTTHRGIEMQSVYPVMWLHRNIIASLRHNSVLPNSWHHILIMGAEAQWIVLHHMDAPDSPISANYTFGRHIFPGTIKMCSKSHPAECYSSFYEPWDRDKR